MQEYIQEQIENEGGIYGLNIPLVESGIDSFGVVMVLNEVQAEYPFMKEGYLKEFPIETITPAKLEELYNENTKL